MPSYSQRSYPGKTRVIKSPVGGLSGAQDIERVISDYIVDIERVISDCIVHIEHVISDYIVDMQSVVTAVETQSTGLWV